MFGIFGSQNFVKDSVIGYGLCVCSLYSVSTAIVKYKSKATFINMTVKHNNKSNHHTTTIWEVLYKSKG